jgi:hypothetical protein
MREKRLVETTKQKGTPAQLKAWRDNAKKARAALKAKVAAKHKEEVIA